MSFRSRMPLKLSLWFGGGCWRCDYGPWYGQEIVMMNFILTWKVKKTTIETIKIMHSEEKFLQILQVRLIFYFELRGGRQGQKSGGEVIQGRRRWVGRVERVHNCPPRFWQISYIILSQPEGADCAPHYYCLPAHLYVASNASWLCCLFLVLFFVIFLQNLGSK